TGKAQVDAQPGRGQRQRMGNIVAIADVRQAYATERVETLVQRQQIGEDLTRVLAVGQGIDDRHSGVGRQPDHVGVPEDARDDQVDVAAQDAGRVDNALTLAELDLGGRQVDRVTTQLEHGYFERHARA